MPTEAETLFALLNAAGVGYKTVNRAVAAAQGIGRSLSELVELPEKELIGALGVGQNEVALAIANCGPNELDAANKALSRLARAGASVLSCTDRDYPLALIEHLGQSTPPILTVMGALELLGEPSMAIVGGRKASNTGLTLAADSARWCVAHGIPVVSGGARGIDHAAHEACLKAAGRTVVVLPQGLMTYRGSRLIMEAVEEGNAALVSEFAPDAQWATHAAVTRNATICALARKIAVIDPRKTGGSIRTARLGLAQGKIVAVYDGAAVEPVAESLFQEGALPLAPGGILDTAELKRLWQSETTRPQQGELC